MDETEGMTDKQGGGDSTSPPVSNVGVPPAPDDHIGPYKLLSLLGDGACGIVYLAQQQKPVKRRVALKVIKPGKDSKQVLARFEAEQQALALLDHPNIAHVFDPGVTKDGKPYFTMEYVHGVPITEHCDQYKLSIEDRLKLFCQVCMGIQHAHEMGIIHRDIKPSNILVTIQGEQVLPIIVDFGVAKAISLPLTDKTLVTEQGQLIGTLEYMSPEQIELNAQDIDRRSDIYSLGVLLFELLAGILPFDSKKLRSVSFSEARRIIKEVDPPKPSKHLLSLGNKAEMVAQKRHTELSALTKRLSQELEWIPLKALRKDRLERYQTASDFAKDILNYLSGSPLSAGPETATYVIKKFIRKRRTVVVATTIAIAALMVGFIISNAFNNVAPDENISTEPGEDIVTMDEMFLPKLTSPEAGATIYSSVIKFLWSEVPNALEYVICIRGYQHLADRGEYFLLAGTEDPFYEVDIRYLWPDLGNKDIYWNVCARYPDDLRGPWTANRKFIYNYSNTVSIPAVPSSDYNILANFEPQKPIADGKSVVTVRALVTDKSDLPVANTNVRFLIQGFATRNGKIYGANEHENRAGYGFLPSGGFLQPEGGLSNLVDVLTNEKGEATAVFKVPLWKDFMESKPVKIVAQTDNYKYDSKLMYFINANIPPHITRVQVSDVTTSGATITWNTDKPSTSQVEYGAGRGYDPVYNLDKNLTTNHYIQLSELHPETAYNFRVRSRDASGNETISSNYSFTTKSGAGNLPPVAHAGSDQDVTDTDGNGSEPIDLDGSGSYDQDGAIQSYIWREGAEQIAAGVNATVNLGVGIHTIFLIVTENNGATSTDRVIITVASPRPDFYTIISSAGLNGSIEPSGSVQIPVGSDQHFIITPDPGFLISDVMIDGISRGTLTYFTFRNIISNHTITVIFSPMTSISLPTSRF